MSARQEDLQTCPSCGREKMYVNRAKAVYHCFRCGDSGKIQKLGITPAPTLPIFLVDESVSHTLCPEHHDLTGFSQEYLVRTRGVGWWLVSGLPIFSTQRGILFLFPDWDYWQVRQWSATPKWLGPHGAPAGVRDGVTYNLNISSSDRVVLVEGVGDALKVATAGHNVAALLSNTLHDSQAEALSRMYARATVMLDADVPIGRVAQAMNLASEHFDAVDLVFLTSGDPGGLSIDDLKGVLSG